MKMKSFLRYKSHGNNRSSSKLSSHHTKPPRQDHSFPKKIVLHFSPQKVTKPVPFCRVTVTTLTAFDIRKMTKKKSDEILENATDNGSGKDANNGALVTPRRNPRRAARESSAATTPSRLNAGVTPRRPNGGKKSRHEQAISNRESGEVLTTPSRAKAAKATRPPSSAKKTRAARATPVRFKVSNVRKVRVDESQNQEMGENTPHAQTNSKREVSSSTISKSLSPKEKQTKRDSISYHRKEESENVSLTSAISYRSSGANSQQCKPTDKMPISRNKIKEDSIAPENADGSSESTSSMAPKASLCEDSIPSIDNLSSIPFFCRASDEIEPERDYRFRYFTPTKFEPVGIVVHGKLNFLR